jgi:hypothetical protein
MGMLAVCIFFKRYLKFSASAIVESAKSLQTAGLKLGVPWDVLKRWLTKRPAQPAIRIVAS